MIFNILDLTSIILSFLKEKEVKFVCKEWRKVRYNYTIGINISRSTSENKTTNCIKERPNVTSVAFKKRRNADESFNNDEYNLILTDADLLNIATFYPNLKRIRLDYTCVNKVSDISIAAIAIQCPNLTEIDVVGSTNVTDDSIVMLTEQCDKIRSIGLCNTSITDRAVHNISIKYPNLTFIDISACFNVTDDAVFDIANHCPNLTTINLCSCFNISDDSVIALSTQCVKLTIVYLSLCFNLTDVAVMFLAKHCTKLTCIDISHCYNITPMAVAIISVNHPYCEIGI